MEKRLQKWLSKCKNREAFLRRCFKIYGLVETEDLEVVWDSAYRVAFVWFEGNIHSIYPSTKKILQVA